MAIDFSARPIVPTARIAWCTRTGSHLEMREGTVVEVGPCTTCADSYVKAKPRDGGRVVTLRNFNYIGVLIP